MIFIAISVASWSLPALNDYLLAGLGFNPKDKDPPKGGLRGLAPFLECGTAYRLLGSAILPYRFIKDRPH